MEAVEKPVAAAPEFSMSDIRRVLGGSPGQPVEVLDVEASEAVKPADKVEPEAKPAATTELAETEEQTDNEPELSPGARKRVEEITRDEVAIRHAISARKAAQAELDKLPAKPGSQPEQTSVAANPEPVEPDELDKKYDGDGGYALFRADQKKYGAEYREWLREDTRRTVESEFSSRQSQTAAQKVHADATVAHGADWPQHRDVVIAATPEAFQVALSGLSDWPTLVAHLGKTENAAELKGLSDRFAREPYEVVGDLKILRDKLKSAKQPVVEKPKEKELPEPLSKVGGNAAPGSGSVDYEKSKFSTVKKDLNRIFPRKTA